MGAYNQDKTMAQLDVQSKNVGTSNYAEQKIQPWDVFRAHQELNYWEGDIIKRVLREKGTTPEEKRENKRMDLNKIIHCCEYLIANFDELYTNRFNVN